MQTTYFIADLHLTQERTDITACFLSFLHSKAPEAETLYILGDFFEYWVGDDDDDPFVLNIAAELKALSDKGTKIYFIQGNRDFLIGKAYAKKAGMTLLADTEIIDVYGRKALIMHGDTLCTKDIEYQKFRKKSRSWWWQLIIKSLPLSMRKKIANDYRAKSAKQKSSLTQEIMDVTESEVKKSLEQANVDLLIHGHTHRPAVHDLIVNHQPAQRIVLGDWHEQGAWLKATKDGFTLLNEAFDQKKEQ